MYSKRRSRLLGDAAQALMSLGSWWGGEGLPGTNVPLYKHPKINRGERKVFKLPMVHINSSGQLILEEEKGWDAEFHGKALEDAGGDDDWEDERNYGKGGAYDTIEDEGRSDNSDDDERDDGIEDEESKDFWEGGEGDEYFEGEGRDDDLEERGCEDDMQDRRDDDNDMEDEGNIEGVKDIVEIVE